MTKEVSGYELSRRWFDFCFENPEKVNPIHTAIYVFAIEHNNRLAWKEKFGFPTTMAMEALGIKKYQTYISRFNDLVDWGFIILIEKSKNQYSSNIISLQSAMPKNGKALDKAFVKHGAKQGQSTGQSKDSIDKQLNKETIEQVNKGSDEENIPEELEEPILTDPELFENFRVKYLGTKKGLETEFNNFKKKHKDWKEIVPTLENIIDNQIQSKARDKLLGKFVPEWKNLQTWINNRCWEEEYGVVTPFAERTLEQHYEEYVSYDLPFDHFRKYNRDKMESRPLRELAFKLEAKLSSDPKYK